MAFNQQGRGNFGRGQPRPFLTRGNHSHSSVHPYPRPDHPNIQQRHVSPIGGFIPRNKQVANQGPRFYGPGQLNERLRQNSFQADAQQTVGSEKYHGQLSDYEGNSEEVVQGRVYAGQGYDDDIYAKEGYGDDVYVKEEYSDDGYAKEGYGANVYAEEGYGDDGYAKKGYGDDVYTEGEYDDGSYLNDQEDPMYDGKHPVGEYYEGQVETEQEYAGDEEQVYEDATAENLYEESSEDLVYNEDYQQESWSQPVDEGQLTFDETFDETQSELYADENIQFDNAEGFGNIEHQPHEHLTYADAAYHKFGRYRGRMQSRGQSRQGHPHPTRPSNIRPPKPLLKIPNPVSQTLNPTNRFSLLPDPPMQQLRVPPKKYLTKGPIKMKPLPQDFISTEATLDDYSRTENIIGPVVKKNLLPDSVSVKKALLPDPVTVKKALLPNPVSLKPFPQPSKKSSTFIPPPVDISLSSYSEDSDFDSHQDRRHFSGGSHEDSEHTGIFPRRIKTPVEEIQHFERSTKNKGGEPDKRFQYIKNFPKRRISDPITDFEPADNVPVGRAPTPVTDFEHMEHLDKTHPNTSADSYSETYSEDRFHMSASEDNFDPRESDPDDQSVHRSNKDNSVLATKRSTQRGAPSKRIKLEIFEYSHAHKPDFMETRPSKVKYHARVGVSGILSDIGAKDKSVGQYQQDYSNPLFIADTYDYEHDHRKDVESVLALKDQSGRKIDHPVSDFPSIAPETIDYSHGEKGASVAVEESEPPIVANESISDTMTQPDESTTTECIEPIADKMDEDIRTLDPPRATSNVAVLSCQNKESSHSQAESLINESENASQKQKAANFELTKTLLNLQKTMQKIGQVIKFKGNATVNVTEEAASGNDQADSNLKENASEVPKSSVPPRSVKTPELLVSRSESADKTESPEIDKEITPVVADSDMEIDSSIEDNDIVGPEVEDNEKEAGDSKAVEETPNETNEDTTQGDEKEETKDTTVNEEQKEISESEDVKNPESTQMQKKPEKIQKMANNAPDEWETKREYKTYKEWREAKRALDRKIAARCSETKTNDKVMRKDTQNLSKSYSNEIPNSSRNRNEENKGHNRDNSWRYASSTYGGNNRESRGGYQDSNDRDKNYDNNERQGDRYDNRDRRSSYDAKHKYSSDRSRNRSSPEKGKDSNRSWNDRTGSKHNQSNDYGRKDSYAIKPDVRSKTSERTRTEHKNADGYSSKQSVKSQNVTQKASSRSDRHFSNFLNEPLTAYKLDIGTSNDTKSVPKEDVLKAGKSFEEKKKLSVYDESTKISRRFTREGSIESTKSTLSETNICEQSEKLPEEKRFQSSSNVTKLFSNPGQHNTCREQPKETDGKKKSFTKEVNYSKEEKDSESSSDSDFSSDLHSTKETHKNESDRDVEEEVSDNDFCADSGSDMSSGECTALSSDTTSLNNSASGKHLVLKLVDVQTSQDFPKDLKVNLNSKKSSETNVEKQREKETLKKESLHSSSISKEKYKSESSKSEKESKIIKTTSFESHKHAKESGNVDKNKHKSKFLPKEHTTNVKIEKTKVIKEPKMKANNEKMFSSDSDDSSQGDIFGKISALLAGNKKKLGLKSPFEIKKKDSFYILDKSSNEPSRNELSKPRPVNMKETTPTHKSKVKNMTMGTSFSSISDLDLDIEEHEKKPGNKTPVKDLKNIHGRLYWKRYKLMFPRVKVKRLSKGDIKSLKLKLKFQRSKSSEFSIPIKKKNTALESVLEHTKSKDFKRIKVFSDSSSPSKSDMSEVERVVYVAHTFVKKPVIISESDEMSDDQNPIPDSNNEGSDSQVTSDPPDSRSNEKKKKRIIEVKSSSSEHEDSDRIIIETDSAEYCGTSPVKETENKKKSAADHIKKNVSPDKDSKRNLFAEMNMPSTSKGPSSSGRIIPNEFDWVVSETDSERTTNTEKTSGMNSDGERVSDFSDSKLSTPNKKKTADVNLVKQTLGIRLKNIMIPKMKPSTKSGTKTELAANREKYMSTDDETSRSTIYDYRGTDLKVKGKENVLSESEDARIDDLKAVDSNASTVSDNSNIVLKDVDRKETNTSQSDAFSDHEVFESIIDRQKQFKRVDSNATTRSETSISTTDDDNGFEEIDAKDDVVIASDHRYEGKDTKPSELPVESNFEELSEISDLETAIGEHFEIAVSMDENEMEMQDLQKKLEDGQKKRKNTNEMTDTSDDEMGCSTGTSGTKQKSDIKSNDCSTSKTMEGKQKESDKTSGQDGGKQNNNGKENSLNNNGKARRRNRLSLTKRRNSSTKKPKQSIVLNIQSEESGEEGDVEDNISFINMDPPSLDDEEMSPSQDLFKNYEFGCNKKKQEPVFANASQPPSLPVAPLTVFNDMPKLDKVADKRETGTTFDKQDKNGSDNDSDVPKHKKETNQTVGKQTARGPNGSDMENQTEDVKVKDEPPWLTFGYTQEPDTIFLSDEGDMIMSSSQPTISLISSDEDAHQPSKQDEEDTEKYEVKIKEEKEMSAANSENEFINEFQSDFSDDWSDDKGSDFDPNDMFDVINKSTSTLLTVANMTDSESYIPSDEDIFKSQGANVKIEKQVSNVQSEVDESIVNNTVEQESKKIKHTEAIVEPKSGHKKVEDVDELDFSSGDDDIMMIPMSGEDEADNKPVVQKEASVLVSGGDVLATQDMSQNTKTLVKEPNMITIPTAVSNKSPSGYDEMTPCKIEQETQIDSDIGDDSNNGVSVFDFYSEHFSDISDSEAEGFGKVEGESNQQEQMVKAGIGKINESSDAKSTTKLSDYDTISDDSDVIVIDNADDADQLERQISEFLTENKNLTSSSVENKKETSDKTTKKKVRFEKGNKDDSETPPVKNIDEEDDIYNMETQVEEPDQDSTLVEEEQSELNHFELSDLDLSEPEDPQSQDYFAKTQVDTHMHSRRLSGNLGIKFVTFEDSDKQTTDDDVYGALTQVDAISNRKTVRFGDRIKNVSSRVDENENRERTGKPSLTDKTTYHSVQGVSKKSDSVDANIFQTPTQVDKEDSVLDVYSAATQVEYENVTDEDGENKENVSDKTVKGNQEAYTMATFQDDHIIALSDISDMDDDQYLAPTQAYTEVEDNTIDDRYIDATQVYGDDTPNTEEDKYLAGTQAYTNDNLYKHQMGDKVENDEYFMATQVDHQSAIPNKKSDDNEELDEYCVATQIDTNSGTDHDARYLGETRVPEKNDTNEVEEMDDVDTKYMAATQVPFGKSDDESEKGKPDEGYFMATQVGEVELDDLPDLDVQEDPYLLATQVDSVVDDVIVFEKMEKDNRDKEKKGSLKLKRPCTGSQNRDSNSVAVSAPTKKQRLELLGKRVMITEPQKLKTTAEKRNSGVMLGRQSSDLGAKQTGSDKLGKAKSAKNEELPVVLLDANTNDMWLSKKSAPDTSHKKGKGATGGKRKRKENPADLIKAKMQAAKSRLKERQMQSIVDPSTLPDTHKRQRHASADAQGDVGDVDLPSCSQIVNMGLPILNPTGLLTRKPFSHTEKTLEMTMATVSITTTTTSIATTTVSIATTPVSITTTSFSLATMMPITSQSVMKVSSTKRKHSISDQESQSNDKSKSSKHKKSSSKENHPQRHANIPGKEKSKLIGDRSHRTSVSATSSIAKSAQPTTVSSKSSVNAGVLESEKTELSLFEKTLLPVTSSSVVTSASKPVASAQVSVKPGTVLSASKPVVSAQISVKPGTVPSASKPVVSAQISVKPGTVPSVSKPLVSAQISVKPGTVPSASKPVVSAQISVKPGTVRSATCRGSPVTTTHVTSVAAGMSSSAARSTAPGRQTHVSSSVMLQKKSSGNQQQHVVTSPQQGMGHVTMGANHLTNRATAVSSCNIDRQGRQPLQSLQHNNIPVGGERMPPNMVDRNTILKWDDFLRVILKWSPNWFEEREKMEQVGMKKIAPPPVTDDLCGRDNHTLYPLLERYETYKEYSEKFMLPLLLLETWESCFSSWREEKAKKRLQKHRLMFSHLGQAGEKVTVYTLHGLIGQAEKDRGSFANEGDLVNVSVFGELRAQQRPTTQATGASGGPQKIWYRMFGFVDKISFKEVSVERLCNHNKEIAKQRPNKAVSMTLKIIVRYRAFTPDSNVLIEVEVMVPVSTTVATKRQFSGLAKLPQNQLCEHLLFPTNNLTYCDISPASVFGSKENYNESQSKAINTAARVSILPHDKPRVCLLQGPPGTGKSHTVIGIIKKIIQESKGQGRVCLCAPSHSAVDELLRRLVKVNKEKKGQDIKMVRLGKKNSVHPEIQPFLLDHLVQKNILRGHQEELRKQLPQSIRGEMEKLDNKIASMKKKMEGVKDQFQKQKLTTNLKKLEKEKEVLTNKCQIDVKKISIDHRQEKEQGRNLLSNAHVIAGTLSSIGSQLVKTTFQDLARKQKQAFHCVIIDEATQAVELDTLIPLQYGSTKLILVGDPEQLPPTVISQVAMENKFNMSLFERLDSHFTSTDHSPVILLDTQYRMDPEIAHFPNQYVYEGRIKNDISVLDRSQCPLVPYLLYNIVEGKELFSQSSRSMSNVLEAEFTAQLCKYIVDKSPVTEKVIGIIAPYAKQKTEVMNQLRHRGLTSIEVSTVDGFQGREKHVIIMSCVRANVAKRVGFVGSRNRMNVSLTRAKYAMYLVGHFESFEANDEWKMLITDARQRKKIVVVDQSSMKNALRRCLKKG